MSEIYNGIDPTCGCAYMWCVDPHARSKNSLKPGHRYWHQHLESTADSLANVILEGGIVTRGEQAPSVKDCPNCRSRRAEYNKPPSGPAGTLFYVRVPVYAVVLAADHEAAVEALQESIEVGVESAAEFGEGFARVIREPNDMHNWSDWKDAVPVTADTRWRDNETPTCEEALAAYGSVTTEPAEAHVPHPNQAALPFAAAEERDA